MDYPIIIKYFLAVLPFVVLIYVLFLVGSTKKTPPKLKFEEPPFGSGWVYLLERDGYIKVGHSKYFNNENKPEEDSFIKRLNNYVSDTSQPNIHNVNIFYYHFLPNAADWDNNIRNLLLGNAVKLTSVSDYIKLKGGGFTCKEVSENEFVFNNVFNNNDKYGQNVSNEADSVQTQINLNQANEHLRKMNDNIQSVHHLNTGNSSESVNFSSLDINETNPYFDKIYKDSNNEWFKINDYNHKEDNINKLFSILDLLRLKGENIDSIIKKSNDKIFNTPRVFLSKLPKMGE